MIEFVPGGSNLIFRQFRLAQGEFTRGHSHNYDHAMLVITGSLRVFVRDAEASTESKSAVLKPGMPPVLVAKEKFHEVEALEDALYYCVFAARDAKGDVVDFWNGNMEAAH